MGNEGYSCRHFTPPLPSGIDLTLAAYLRTGPKANLKSPDPLKPIFANSPSIPAFAKVSAAFLLKRADCSACHLAEAAPAGGWRVEILLSIIRKGQIDRRQIDLIHRASIPQ
jgi:hypothetical protein